MKILITGGLGYIGSHISYLLGNKAVVIDNCSNSSLNYKRYLPKAIVYKKSINFETLCKIFSKHSISAVIHLASLKAVSDSVDKPLLYYENNFLSSFELLKAMNKFNINKLIFSSSATVYGNNKNNPLVENNVLNATNPYGNTKILIENLITDYSKSNNKFKAISLRYFNPIGSDILSGLQDKPLGKAQNIMPLILDSASGVKKLIIFGKNYNTKDGTGVRDYIHIKDLALAHLCAIRSLIKINGHIPINIGLGKGLTVLELIRTFEKVNNIKVPFKFGKNRKGDVDISFANNKLAKKILKWSPKYTYEDMCSDAWNSFQKKWI